VHPLVRKHKNYDPVITARIYGILEKRSSRYSDLILRCEKKLSSQSLYEYLAHGKEVGEVAKEEGKRGKYYLTSKGYVRLQQIKVEQKMHKHRKWYDGYVDTIDKPWEKEELVDPAIFGTAMTEMPLPLPAYAALSGSVDLDHLREDAESLVLRRRAIRDPYNTEYDPLGVGLFASFIDAVAFGSHFPPPLPKKLGSKELYREARQLATAGWARQVVKQAIRINMMHLLELHHDHDRNNVGEDPPTLNLESILGFDITFTVSYDGSKLRAAENLSFGQFANREEMRRRMACRMVGWLLLEVAHDEGCDAPEAFNTKSMSAVRSMYETVPLLKEAGLLCDEDVDKIRQGGIVEIAFRYLREAGALAFNDVPARQTDQDLWIKLIECYVERCPQCHWRFGANDRCMICETPRRRDNPFTKTSE